MTEIRPPGFLRPVTLAWCPDSRCIVLTDASSPDRGQPDALFVVWIESRERQQLTTPTASMLADNDPAISPDGRWLAFRRDIAPYSGQLQVVGLDASLATTGTPRSLTTILSTAYNPEWISNTEIVFGAKGSLWRMRIDAGATPERLPFVGEKGIMPASGTRGTGGRDVSPTCAALPTPTSGAWTLRRLVLRPTSLAVVAIASTRRDALAQLSPDGRRVTFISDRRGEPEVWASDVSGENAVQLTSLGANPGYARWSPDGQFVAFHSNSEDHAHGAPFVVPAEGGRARRLTSAPSTDTFPSYSRDGRWLYFASSRVSGTPAIWKMPASGGDAVRVSPTAGLLGIESSDGSHLYYVESTSLTVPGPLWRLTLATGERAKLADNADSLSFAVTDDGIYFADRASGLTRLNYLDLATQRTTVVVEDLGRVPAGMGISATRDGRTILFTRIDSSTDDLMLVENFR